MTREEQIIETAKEYYNPKNGTPFSLQMRVGFITGAKWADRTMIEKACEYLKNNIDPELVIYHENTWTRIDKFIDNFRKAMKNSQ